MNPRKEEIRLSWGLKERGWGRGSDRCCPRRTRKAALEPLREREHCMNSLMSAEASAGRGTGQSAGKLSPVTCYE